MLQLTCRTVAVILSIVTPASYSQSTVMCMVQGHVLTVDGRPLANFHIDVLPLEAAVSGPLPLAVSDTEGAFRIRLPAVGKTRFYAESNGSGYPDAKYKLFSSKEDHFPEIVLTPDCSQPSVDIHLGPPDGSISGTVVDRVTGRPLKTARLTLRWAEDPSVMNSENTAQDGSFFYSLPDRAMSMEVTAPGYKKWTYSQTFGEDLKIGPLDHRTMEVILDAAQ